MSDAHELLDDLEGTGRQLREKIPGVYSGYVKMAAAAMGDGGWPAAGSKPGTAALGQRQ